MLTFYTKTDLEKKMPQGTEYHVGEEVNGDIENVEMVFADGDEKDAIDQFLQGIPTSTAIGVRSFYWYGSTAKSIMAFLSSYGGSIRKLGVQDGKNVFHLVLHAHHG